MRKAKIEHLSKDELRIIEGLKLNDRQLMILDYMKSWSNTTADEEGYFSLSTNQITNAIGVSERTIRRDLTILKDLNLVRTSKKKVSSVKFNVNSYKLIIYKENVPTTSMDIPVRTSMDKMSNSNIIYNIKTNTNNKTTNNYKLTNTVSVGQKEEKTDDCMIGRIEFKFEHFDIEFQFNSDEELEKVAEKALALNQKIEESLQGEKELGESVVNHSNSEEKMQIGDELKELWNRIDREIQELKSKPLSVATEMLCVGENHYPKFIEEVKKYISNNSSSMSVKQLGLCNSKVSALEDCVRMKIENCHKYVGKTQEEIDRQKTLDNLQELGKRLGSSVSKDEYNDKIQKLGEWCGEQMSKGTIIDRDESLIMEIIKDAEMRFLSNDAESLSKAPESLDPCNCPHNTNDFNPDAGNAESSDDGIDDVLDAMFVSTNVKSINL